MIYIGGSFTTANGNASNRIVKYDGSNWTNIGTGIGGNYVNKLLLNSGNLYAGGQYSTAGGTSANCVAKWDVNNWLALGTGMSGSWVFGGAVVACMVFFNDTLYAGGDFINASGNVVNGIAKWDGSSWVAIGSGIGHTSTPYYLNDMIVYNNELYVGGIFTSVNGVSANYIARYNGTNWSSVGTGLNDWVGKFLVKDGELYAGGSFTNAGGVSANFIAKWNGSTWSAIGSGFNAGCAALCEYYGDLYAGGSFTTADGASANHIAKWDGTNWSALSSGVNNNVLDLAIFNGDLYVGGSFSTAGGLTTNNIAKWNNCINPSTAATPTGTTQLCVNPPNTNYTTTGATNATAYVWEISPSGAGVITGTGTTSSVDWDNTYTGTATIIVKGTNGTGCEGAFSNTLSVTINPLPTVTIKQFLLL